jgi:hypothetical protein
MGVNSLHLHDAAALLDKFVVAAREASSALNEATEYFADRADADCDQDGFIPNEEMKLYEVMEAAMAALDALIAKATLQKEAA